MSQTESSFYKQAAGPSFEVPLNGRPVDAGTNLNSIVYRENGEVWIDVKNRNDIFVILTPIHDLGSAYAFLYQDLEYGRQETSLFQKFCVTSRAISVEDGMYGLFFLCTSICTSGVYELNTKRRAIRVLEWFLRHFGHFINFNLYVTTGENLDGRIIVPRETLSKPLKLAESYEPLHNLLLQHLKQTIIIM
jgi:hypothetical protein